MKMISFSVISLASSLFTMLASRRLFSTALSFRRVSLTASLIRPLLTRNSCAFYTTKPHPTSLSPTTKNTPSQPLTQDLSFTGHNYQISCTLKRGEKEKTGVVFMVDTGASYSQVDLETAVELGLVGHERLLGRSMIGDGRAKYDYLSQVTITILDTPIEIVIKVGENQPCLIGVDVLHALSIDLILSEKDLLYIAICSGERTIRKYTKHPDIICTAIKGNHLDCVKYLLEKGWSMAGHCEVAAEYGSLECLKLMKENGCKWSINACRSAAFGGHLDCLVYLHENGSEWDTLTCSTAACTGHLEILKYARENGCEWNGETCTQAAQHGHLECLKYAHENGCRWKDISLYFFDMYDGDFECFKYAIANGCPATLMLLRLCMIMILDLISFGSF